MNHIEKIKEFQAEEKIEKLAKDVEEIEENEALGSIEIELLLRIKQVLSMLKTSYINCEKNLIAINWVHSIINSISSIEREINNYRSSKNLAYLNPDRYTAIDSILAEIVKLNCVRNRQNTRGIIDSLENYKEKMFGYLKEYEEKIKEVNVELEDIRTAFEGNEKNLDNSVNSLKGKIDVEQVRLDNILSEHQAQMQNENVNFSNMLLELKEEFKKEKEESLKEFEKENNEFVKKQEQIISEYKSKFASHEKKVEEITGILSKNMFSHKYREVADNAKKSARVWHFVTVVAMIVVGFVAYITLQGNDNWIELVGRIFTIATLTATAAYTARQAGKQDEIEKETRRVEMELVALDPFIADLDEETRGRLKEQLSKNIFLGKQKKDENVDREG